MKSRLLAHLAALAIIAAGAATLRAQPVQLLGDLAAEGSPDYDSFGVQPIGVVNGKALLQAPSSPGTLWASDGSAAGTVAIADLAFAGGSFGPIVASSPQRVYLILDAVGRVNGARALRTDGTRPGTFFLRDAVGVALVPSSVSRPAPESNGGLYLFACTGDTQCGIWFNDGGAATSQLLVPLDRGSAYNLTMVSLGGSLYWTDYGSQVKATSPGQPGARLVFGSSGGIIQGFTAAGGRLYFATSSTAGEEAWSSDGTSAGTRVLTSFPNASPFYPYARFQAAAGRVYFLADDVVHGQELWSTDGSVAGTRRETDFGYYRPFGDQQLADQQTVGLVGGRLVFAASDGLDGLQLWSSVTGAAPVPLLDSCGPDCAPLAGRSLLVANGRAFFVAADPNHGYEMWSTDGTKAGTRLLVDSCPGSCGGWGSGDPTQRVVMVAGNRVVFWTAHDLWITDGTAAGTHSLFHSEQYLLWAGPRLVVAVGERLLFPGFDPAYGAEIFVADLATGASELLVPLLNNATNSSQPQLFTGFGNRALFSALSTPTSSAASLWITDGTPGGTAEVPGVVLPACGDSSGSLCPPFIVAGGEVFFIYQDEHYDFQLWSTDVTAAGPLQLTHFAEGLPSFYFHPVALADKIYFGRSSYTGDVELWSSDGTPAGTVAQLTLPGLHEIFALTAVGSELYFNGRSDTRTDVWRTDGTLAGTHQVNASVPNGLVGSSFVRAGNAVWFLAGPGTNELWRTDGTPAGTRLVANPNVASDLVSFQGVLYFFAQASPSERALWRVNEQQDGITQLVRFPGSGFGGDGGSGLKVFQGNLYFVANSAGEGAELWRSDGTAAGTHLVRDVNPGADGSAIASLVATPQSLFFAADDGIHGLELWRSDGTAQGTELVHDLWPGPTGSSPTTGAVAGSHFVFGATDDVFGREPWTLDMTAPRTCIASDTALCLRANRFLVTATWKDFAGNRGAGHAKPLTADTGYFWFFGEENVEAVIKVLDGHGVNGHDWVFYGALSSVEYTLTVTDTQTGAVRRYFNPSGRLASVGDTQGFGPLGAYAHTPPPAAAPEAPARRIASGDTSPCVAGTTQLCLAGGRFAVQATWKDFSGHTGVGHAGSLTGDTGYLWFFSDSNVEVVIKVLDGRPVNGRFWLFYGALSSVEYTLTVRDTVTGAVRVYRNPSGRMASVADTAAF